MNKHQYLRRLRQLLEDQYQLVKQSAGKAVNKNARIEGYMEAGLVADIANRDELKQVINDAHKTVFGVTFDERCTTNIDAENLWDIPTWIRKGVEIES